ncbi:hypothetical protein [Algoriphagus formosus]|uniref:hypothetical protein n=1 Tax=Algoriphagus formosus TaxID=2007308 RepID=UPI003F6FABE6
MNRNFAFVGLLLFILGCTESVVLTPRDYPFLKTLEIKDINGTGATMDFEMLDTGIFPLTSYGVEYLEKSLYDQPFYEGEYLKVEIEDTPEIGRLSVRMSTDLVEGTEYVARPFVKQNGLTSYGEFMTFTAQGSSAPIIKEVSSYVLGMRLEIIIQGEYFSQRIANNEIRVPGTEPYFAFEIFEASSDQLRVRVFANVLKESYSDNERYDLQVLSGGQSDVLDRAFSIGYPRIASISTLSAAVGEEIFVELILEEERAFMYLAGNYEQVFFLAMLLEKVEGNLYRTQVTDYPPGEYSLGLLMEGIYNPYPQNFTVLEN